VKINFTVPFRRVLATRTLSVAAPTEPQGRAPRIARLLALAYKLEAMVRSGEIEGYAELARLGHISPARLYPNHGSAASGADDPRTHTFSRHRRRPVHHRIVPTQDRA
jgi:hypothetical protein